MTRANESISIDVDAPNDVKQVQDEIAHALIGCLSEAAGNSIEEFEPVTVEIDVSVGSQSDESQPKNSHGWAPAGDGTSEEPRDESRYKCGECGTVCEEAPGIGHYCPNQACSIGDGPGLIELEDGEAR